MVLEWTIQKQNKLRMNDVIFFILLMFHNCKNKEFKEDPRWTRIL